MASADKGGNIPPGGGGGAGGAGGAGGGTGGGGGGAAITGSGVLILEGLISLEMGEVESTGLGIPPPFTAWLDIEFTVNTN